jgi:hypothetical protein
MVSDITMNDATEAITERFIAGFSSTVTTVDPENFTPPDDAPWIRLSIRHTSASQWTLGQIGNRKFQRNGLIIGSIFTPLNKGRQPSDLLTQQFKDLFEGVNFGPVECYIADTKELPIDGLWFPVAVQVKFNYNETK